MADLKEKLRADLSAAMKERDSDTTGVLRMALAAVGKEEVAGKQARELSDEEVLKVLSKEVKKRDESAAAFRDAGREERAAAEESEAEVLRRYLPQPLSEDELSQLVDEAIAEVEAELGEKPGMKQMGQVMKAANAKAGGRAEGGQVAGQVKAKLQG